MNAPPVTQKHFLYWSVLVVNNFQSCSVFTFSTHQINAARQSCILNYLSNLYNTELSWVWVIFQSYRAVNTAQCGSEGQWQVKPIWWVTFAPLLTVISSVWSPFLLYPVNMPPLSPLHCLCVFFPIFSQSTVLSLFLQSSPPNLLQACISNRLMKKRGELLHGPPGVVSDGEAVPVVLCIQWKEQGWRGVHCISWASSLIKTLLFLPPPSHSFSWSLECTRRLQELQVADGGRS